MRRYTIFTSEHKDGHMAVGIRLCSNNKILESRLHAVERVPSNGRGKTVQFIPIRFTFTNNLTKNDKLMLAFDALLLSGMLRVEVSRAGLAKLDRRISGKTAL
jgi:hypothetical protein